MISKRISRQLDSVDWDFPASLPGLTRMAHWYPGTFPPQLPSTLIQALSGTDDLVFDPYGGIGTTAAEAIRLGRKAWIADFNPVGALACVPYASLLLLKRFVPERLTLFLSLFGNHLCQNEEVSKVGQLFEISDKGEEELNLDRLLLPYVRPSFPELSSRIRSSDPNVEGLGKWIHPDTLAEVLDLRDIFLSNAPKGSESFSLLFAEFVISSNLRALCSQNKSWGHIADNVYPKEFVYKNVRKQLGVWMTRLEQSLLRTNTVVSQKPKGIQLWYSMHDWGEENPPITRPRISPSLLLTSPPYGDAIDYINSQRLSLYYLGYDEESISQWCSREIGARRKRFKQDSRTRWAKELAQSSVRQAELMGEGIIAMILPHKNHGREIGMQYMRDSLLDLGWDRVFEVDRSISQKKTRQSWTSIKQETIVVFAKE